MQSHVALPSMLLLLAKIISHVLAFLIIWTRVWFFDCLTFVKSFMAQRMFSLTKFYFLIKICAIDLTIINNRFLFFSTSGIRNINVGIKHIKRT